MDVTQSNNKFCIPSGASRNGKESNPHHLLGSRHNTACTRFSLTYRTRLPRAHYFFGLGAHLRVPFLQSESRHAYPLQPQARHAYAQAHKPSGFESSRFMPGLNPWRGLTNGSRPFASLTRDRVPRPLNLNVRCHFPAPWSTHGSN